MTWPAPTNRPEWAESANALMINDPRKKVQKISLILPIRGHCLSDESIRKIRRFYDAVSLFKYGELL
jgi:hypothetical protein